MKKLINQVIITKKKEEDSIEKEEIKNTPDDKDSTSKPLNVYILHKPRGSKGKMIKIETLECIRVTHVRGKKLRIIVSCTVPCDWKTLTINLLERTVTTMICEDKDDVYKNIDTQNFEIESIQPLSDSQVQIDLKIYYISKKYPIKFHVATSEKGSKTVLSSSTVEFITHDSGRRVPKKHIIEDEVEERSVKKQKIDPAPDEDESMSQNVQIIPTSIDVKGSVRAKAFFQYSDIRLKTNIEDITDAFEIITKLNGKRYQWKDSFDRTSHGGQKVIGLIAQEVKKYLPEIVSTDPETGLLSINYTDIVPILIEAFKQHISNYQIDQGEIKQEVKKNTRKF